MTYRSIKQVTLFTLALVLVFTSIAAAQGIKERMTQRLPVIADLKAKGIVGENNQGYLDFVSSQRTQETVVTSENQDRKIIYTHIAKQQNASVELVAKRRAKQLIDRAAPGQYIQNDAGAWVKK